MTDSNQDLEAAIVDARLAAVAARLGERLTDEARAVIQSRIERSLRLAATLRTMPLGNGDEPEIAFAPFRGEP